LGCNRLKECVRDHGRGWENLTQRRKGAKAQRSIGGGEQKETKVTKKESHTEAQRHGAARTKEREQKETKVA
jgi:hypothetical protein